MNYVIVGKVVPSVEVSLSRGESMFTQSGGMFYQTEGIKMETNTKGGLLKGIGRMFAGESMFMATYTAMQNAKISFASTVPGSIIPINVSEGRFTIQKGAFLAAESSVELKTIFNKKMGTGFFGGEGFILQELRGRGTAFLEIDGDAIEMNLAPGEVIKIDTGNLVGFEDSVKYEVEFVKGIGNVLFGGEGLFLTKLTGPGKVVLQTMNMNEFALRVGSYIPTSSN
ncbi:MAG TPA: TIGR00266 family protein [Terrisporobacter glycolicus]|uniref:TIGR00266 family protein n=1 Tax=Terrisporobacter TaxID=1505652 RepID=UPI000E9691AA|nr:MULTISPECIES: TIGR00266 family protein [Terrisporobacter]MBN9645474.1 TIGR00266 family protein [Terrisporobacter glycolicus]HBI92046.1 TIGR00266 family protein [Terrisporobacter hibernicus]